MYTRTFKLLSIVILLTINNQLKAQYPIAPKPGEIIFTAKPVSLSEPEKMGALRHLVLTNKSNLFITVNLEKTLSAYLHELAPSINTDSLSKIGNYQFSFFVDGKLIYQTELMPGAPRPAQQQTDTIWTKPLIDNQHEGAWWSQSAWNRFMYNGGDNILTEGPHSLKIVFRPYIKDPDLRVGRIIASGDLILTVKRKPVVNTKAIMLSRPKPYPGLAVSDEKLDQNRAKLLKAYINEDVFRHITSVIILKKGKILLEEYFNGSTRDSLHDVRSVGKTFASTLTGMALFDGYLKSLHQNLGSFYKLKDHRNFSGAKSKTTLRELLTMTSRFNGNDEDALSPGNEETMYPQSNWVKFTLDLPMDTIKYHGQWHYFTAGVMLLGSTLDKVVPGGLERYADDKLFKPMGISRYKWQYTPQGAPNTAGGIRMNALDFAKYGQLYANSGKWQGRQLIPAGWVKESLSHQVPITGRANEYYGYLFWNKTYHSEHKAYETYYCSGNGGNKIYVFKDQPLVVVITATAYGSAYGHIQADKIIEEFILPAVFASSK